MSRLAGAAAAREHDVTAVDVAPRRGGLISVRSAYGVPRRPFDKLVGVRRRNPRHGQPVDRWRVDRPGGDAAHARGGGDLGDVDRYRGRVPGHDMHRHRRDADPSGNLPGRVGDSCGQLLGLVGARPGAVDFSDATENGGSAGLVPADAIQHVSSSGTPIAAVRSGGHRRRLRRLCLRGDLRCAVAQAARSCAHPRRYQR
jgi:hypothetical protein